MDLTAPFHREREGDVLTIGKFKWSLGGMRMAAGLESVCQC